MMLAVFGVWRIISRIELSAAATVIAQELSTHLENLRGIENRITELKHIFQEKYLDIHHNKIFLYLCIQVVNFHEHFGNVVCT